MQQYHEAKQVCGDALLLFRMGDFYELFYEDAKTAARVIGLTLTSRDKGENAIPMAGFPHHQLESYLGKLIAAGLRAAVCEQMEDPRQAKGLVKREVTRVVTPGTLTDDALLDPREHNYLAAVALPGSKDRQSQEIGLAWAELSTGRFHAAVFPRQHLADQLARIAPSECLLSEDATGLAETLGSRTMISRRPAWAFSQASAIEGLSRHFGTSGLAGFGFGDEDGLALRAAGAVLDYLKETQRCSLDHLDRLLPYRAGGTLEIDEATRRSLELTRTIRDGRREGSLLAVLDRTATSMGSRQLHDWLANPLCDLLQIRRRQQAVGQMAEHPSVQRELVRQLAGVYDLQRLLARVTTGRASPRDLQFVGRTLAALPDLKRSLAKLPAVQINPSPDSPSPDNMAPDNMAPDNPSTDVASPAVGLLAELREAVDECPELAGPLQLALVDDCPLSPREGGFVRAGFDPRLDQLRELATGGKQWIAEYQAEETRRCGIPSLKVGYNKVFGYYLEVTNAHQEKVPPHYIRKQTLKNAERYITPELKEYEERVLTADDQAQQLEYDIFVRLRDQVQEFARRLQATANALAQLDVLSALADLARQRGYCCPELVAEPVLRIEDGRHPVLDILEPQGTFVPNDTWADDQHGRILLITGPNMAGKSTYIRQVALLVLMAQMGSFVPARRARIGVADRVFARVGASDELSRGQSTFMVEMTETARILNTASPRSLVILDEIGRGTSTYDGISLAWAIVEHLHEQLGCRTLFATHYHELTDLADSLPLVRNLNVSVKEWEDNVVFLHKIVPGAADKSYGIHVARLAGVPRSVNERAKQILAQLEAEHLDPEGRPKVAAKTRQRKGDLQLTLFAPYEHPLLAKIRDVDVNRLTPLEALQLVLQWQGELQ
ncbi:MAG: DNA mismatch repair protein MutS [Pirellulaceae bacterium]|nr:DNA mismatch repair protein MutS [Pirellulaceae bacterium]